MESSNFNLDQSIQAYIDVISNQGSITGSDAAELRDHLYDATADLMQSGLSTEEAFMIATKRLGKSELLSAEYGKVNVSVMTNKVWAYLLAGFSIFYVLGFFLFTLIPIFYNFVFENFRTSDTSVAIVTSFHVMFIGLSWYALKFKRKFSCFIERQVERRATALLVFCIVMVFGLFFFGTFSQKILPTHSVVYYPVRGFESPWTEFSFYMAYLSLAGVLLSLVFSVNKVEALTAKTLLQKPSIAFLVIFGFVVELLAASTRVIRVDNIIFSSILFGLVYLLASFSIVYYNKNNHVKYLAIAFLPVFLLELAVGLSVREDLDVLYFTAATILAVYGGRIFGLAAADRRGYVLEE
ncbi:permease prefix domain 1-containing protein [Pedobacter sp. GR22-6]|uniref:permease prefix domain 1-containing protein n=1 Tax=Pedobacter sp. GR22-6 TaxID=3127957 RepID=UPI00307CF38E